MKKWSLVNFCEKDKFAIKSYCAIHQVSESLNIGDITKVDPKEIQDFDLMTWGFPCTDISISGRQLGFIDNEGNKTRSGLYYDGLRFLKEKKPKISIIENVKNLISKKFEKEFKMILNDLEESGYNNYWKILNAKDYDVPQNRERLFIVSIRKDIDNQKFKFPEPLPIHQKLTDILEKDVDEKFYLSQDKVNKFLENNLLKVLKKYIEKTSTSDIIQLGNLNKSEKNDNPQCGRFYSCNGISPTLTANGHTPKILCIDHSINNTKVKEIANCITTKDRGISNRKSVGNAVVELEDGIRIRRFTPKECWRLMGFPDELFDRVKKEKISNTQLYKQTGNSIVVKVLFEIFLSLYYSNPILFEDLKVCSLFSGIGAFEVALNKLYDSFPLE